MVLAPVVLTVVLTGITLLVRRLRKSEERFRLIAEHAHDLVGLHDPDGKHIWLSPSVERVLGFKAEEMIGRNAY
jgi:PAS domain-containing protein